MHYNNVVGWYYGGAPSTAITSTQTMFYKQVAFDDPPDHRVLVSASFIVTPADSIEGTPCSSFPTGTCRYVTGDIWLCAKQLASEGQTYVYHSLGWNYVSPDGTVHEPVFKRFGPF